jgi:putative membrane protein
LSDEDASGQEPDVRFSLANERTFLAWNRTALALIAGGLAITQLLPPFDIPATRRILGIPLIIFGGVLGYMSLRRWEANEQAIRDGTPLPSSWLPRILSIAIVAGAVVAVVVGLLGHKA